MAGINMGLHPLLSKGGDKRKFRWMFSIQPYIGIGAAMLPPSKGARPNMSFKEYSAEHLNETIYFPGKVEWQTVELTLYDVNCGANPIYEWMKLAYDPDPNNSFFGPSVSTITTPGTNAKAGTQLKTDSIVSLFDGCGNIIEQWVYMNSYPMKTDWTDLDMQSSDPTYVDVSLRFDRAYRIENSPLQKANGAPKFFPVT